MMLQQHAVLFKNNIIHKWYAAAYAAAGTVSINGSSLCIVSLKLLDLKYLSIIVIYLQANGPFIVPWQEVMSPVGHLMNRSSVVRYRNVITDVSVVSHVI